MTHRVTALPRRPGESRETWRKRQAEHEERQRKAAENAGEPARQAYAPHTPYHVENDESREEAESPPTGRAKRPETKGREPAEHEEMAPHTPYFDEAENADGGGSKGATNSRRVFVTVNSDGSSHASPLDD